MRRRRLQPPRPEGHRRVLIVSASMGAGHDGAARNLAEQLRADGHGAEVRDFLDSGPLRIGAALRSGYEFELKHVPSAYDATYRLWYRVPWLCPLVAWLVTVLTRRRVMRWVRDSGADLVVSTYPLATLCLGRLRATGRLDVPAVNFITDFGVHPLWVHRGIDLNLAVHAGPARVAAARTGRPAAACGPAVSSRFRADALPDRDGARRQLGLRPDQRAVLVVAGSWGVGDLDSTVEAVAGDGRFCPVVVCGSDDRLRRHVEAVVTGRSLPAVVLGWTDDMPALMSACDALVENAGGLTSLEAMAAGLPVVSFAPIAGHGKENTAAMDDAGVGRLAPDPASLRAALDRLTRPGAERRAQVERARALFRSRPAAEVLSALDLPAAVPTSGRRAAALATRATLAVASLTALVWGGLTTGVAVATEAGAGVVRPATAGGPVAYVGARLNDAEINNPAVITALRRMHVTAVVDGWTAQADPGALRRLAGDGVTVADGGKGFGPGDSDLPWERARSDARAGRAISALIDSPVTLCMPGRRLTAWDLVAARDAHLSLVVPDRILNPSDPTAAYLIPMKSHHIYLVNGLFATPTQLAAYLDQVQTSLQAAQLTPASLAALA